MMFTLGDLLVLSVVVILIFIFRHLDRNNRSLEKVKRFTDRLQGELAEIAEEKSQQLKDISIGVDVHQQSARRAIERLEASAEELNEKAANIDEIQHRIDQYDLAIKQLVEMTNRAEVNIKGIQKESAYVDTVGRRIKDAIKQMDGIDQQIPGLVAKFDASNRDILEKTSAEVLGESKHMTEELSQAVENARADAHRVLENFESRKTDLENGMSQRFSDFTSKLDERFASQQAELERTEEDFRRRMNEVAGKARNFELQAFEDLKNELDGLRSSMFEEYRQALEQGFARLESELSAADKEFGIKLRDQSDELEARAYRIEQDTEARLKESLDEGQKLADQLLTQIQTDMTSRSDDLRQTLESQLSELDTRVSASHQRIENSFIEIKNQLEQWMERGDGYIHELDGQFSRLSERSVQLEQEHSQRLRSVEEEIARTEAEVNQRFEQIRNDSARLVAESADLVNREIAEAGQVNRQNLEAKFAELDGLIRDTQESAYQQADKIREQIDVWRSEHDENLRAAAAAGEAEITRIEGDFSDRSQAVVRKTAERSQEFEAAVQRDFEAHAQRVKDQLEKTGADIQRIEGLSEQGSRRLSELDVSIQRSLEELGTQLTESHHAIGEKIEADSSLLEQKILSDLEKRLSDYEGSIGYRLARLENLSEELEQLDRQVHQSMEAMDSDVKDRLRSFSSEMQKSWSEDLESARAELAVLSTEVQNHQQLLERMKEQSHQNMSEQLQILEQDFFTDLKARGQGLDERLESWTEEFNNTLDGIRKDSEDQRLSLEKKYLDDFSARLETLRTGVGTRIDEVQSEFRDRESVIREDLDVIYQKLENVRGGVDKQLEDLQSQSQNLIDRRYEDIQEILGNRFSDMQRDLESRVKQMNLKMDEHSNEIQGLHDAVRSDVTLWQNQILQRMKGSESEVEEQMSSFRIRISDTVATLKEEFESEKDGILKDGEAARNALQSGIQDASVQLRELQNNLSSTGEEALNRLSLDIQSFQQEYLSHKADFTKEIDDSTREFRAFVSQTREEFEGTQKRLVERLNEDLRVLEINIREIDKKQKSFLQQTKLFERADSLKQALQDDISHIKSEIDRLQGEGKQVIEMQGEFGKMKQLADEANEKFSRFMVEQRRLEGIEDNYKKLINMSQTVDSQLSKVTAKHDNLQQVQLAIRNLDELQKELDQRYDRLTKRKEIIDTTLEGVDRNFHSLTDLENRIADLGRGISEMGDSMSAMKGRLDSLALNKKESDMAMRNLQNLNAMMAETEERMESMQKAREWLARTETRLEEVAQQADQRLEILGSVASGKSLQLQDDKPAPSVSVRDMVIKLKHQGWKIEDIAKSCKISRGEVELILEMAHR